MFYQNYNQNFQGLVGNYTPEQFYQLMFNNINFYREVAQKLIMKYMYDFFYKYNTSKGYTNKLVFMGGTNLRLCYNLPRWSEDLDFAYIGNVNQFAFKSLIDYVISSLKKKHFLEVEARKINKNTNVWKSFYVFSFLNITKQKLKIKLEIDVKPPENGIVGQCSISSNVTILPFIKPFRQTIINYHPDTTFMGKFGAVLGRGYVKGRDIFDIWWYLNNTYLIRSLNFSYLNSVVEQINSFREKQGRLGIEPIPLSEKGKIKFRNLFLEKISSIIRTDYNKILNDVNKFIFQPEVASQFAMELQNLNFLTNINNLLNLPVT